MPAGWHRRAPRRPSRRTPRGLRPGHPPAPASDPARPRRAPASASPWQMAPPSTPVPPMTAATSPPRSNIPVAAISRPCPRCLPDCRASRVHPARRHLMRRRRPSACGRHVGRSTVGQSRTSTPEGSLLPRYVFDTGPGRPLSIPDPHQRPHHGSRRGGRVGGVLRHPGAGRGRAAARP